MTFKITKHVKVAVLVVIVLSVVVGSLTFFSSKKNNNLQASTFSKSKQDKVIISASYPKYHPDLKSLYVDADVVVYGEVAKEMPSRKDSDLVFTDSEVNVIQYLKNPQTFSNVVIQQDGGTINNTEYINSDIPLFKKGEKYLLFLKHIDDNRYYVMSPIALYEVKNGQAIHKEKSRNKDFNDLIKDINKLQNKN
ncbi:MAG TPA: hypothetical protein DCY12_05155 [Candidatus Atribacteria bacterium]|nr:hypothetical protein [Candidatus Atribacteria bacterium]